MTRRSQVDREGTLAVSRSVGRNAVFLGRARRGQAVAEAAFLDQRHLARPDESLALEVGRDSLRSVLGDLDGRMERGVALMLQVLDPFIIDPTRV